MLNLLIDNGNSSLKAAWSDGTRLKETFRYCGEDAEGYIISLARGKSIGTIALSSVKGLSPDLEEKLKSSCSELIVVSGTSNLPVKNLYLTPQTLGPDRICAAVGANALFPGKNCIILDFGTALTIDFLNERGEFLGGNISPGVSLRFRALNSYTDRLPLANLSGEFSGYGTDTLSAINSGTILGLILETEGYMRRFPHHTYIFTGGDAIYFAEKMKSPIFVVYNLVLIGLAHIAEYNAKI
ncbi:MAG: type III pantothenate kinase [Bacteroidales bacterium]|nr:type III pantothenate kinase [Bacteroidales bacterium]MDD3990055.1 type III pantothenate kinase [Bacteroidales bacterium]